MIWLIAVKSFVTRYAFILALSAVITGLGVGAFALQKWADGKCTAKMAEAIQEAEADAAAERAKITEKLLKQRRSYEYYISKLKSEASAVSNDAPECIQPAGVIGLRNDAVSAVTPRPVNGGASEIRDFTGARNAAIRNGGAVD